MEGGRNNGVRDAERCTEMRTGDIGHFELERGGRRVERGRGVQEATARSCVFVGFAAGGATRASHATRRASESFMVQSLCCLQVRLEVASTCFSRSTYSRWAV